MSGILSVEPVLYQAGYEFFEKDEAQSIAELEKVFVDMAKTVAVAEKHAYRAVHAKGQGLLRGHLTILDDLDQRLAQGIFALPARYDVLVRFSSPPAEQLPDTVSTPRAMALKVIGVPGERVPESMEENTQDFLMVNSPAFVRPGPYGFLKDAKLLAMTTEKMPKAKELISAALRGAEKLVEAVGSESGKIRNMGGQPQTHPLGETYFTQAPFMYGPYMAKFSLVPASSALTVLKDNSIGKGDEDAQRLAMNDFFSSIDTPMEWELRVQLCTDIEKMPIEDASVEWDEALSPYIAVARLSIPAQSAWESTVSRQLEDEISFDPWHAVAAHRPLGAVNRARKAVMAASRQFRSKFNGCPIHEPHSLDENAGRSFPSAIPFHDGKH